MSEFHVPLNPMTEGEAPVLPGVDGELILPVWEPTGDQAVDAALERLNELDDLDASEHVAIFESVHRQLHQRLSDLNAGS
ncbi:MAG: hypothetical protein F2840_13025 [Actinobacteria bacterium]|uniref:Unannotated protein n=1 Tax=freshwater metagenome TaxID=449393 RepID=A0A6J7LGM3_9ZZZZ|nr:hypothetical protein [Actinomycetota bacterium]